MLAVLLASDDPRTSWSLQLVANGIGIAFFTLLYFGPFHSFFVFSFSMYSCRGDYESGGG